MDDKSLSPQESVKLIAAMIQDSKRRFLDFDMPASVVWIIATILTSSLVLVLRTMTGNDLSNYAWLCMPIIGLPIYVALVRRMRQLNRAKTFSDRFCERLWNAVGVIGCGLCMACAIAQMCGNPQVWSAMHYYMFIVIGFGTLAMGLFVKEHSFVFGGICSTFAGFIVIICDLCQKSLSLLSQMELWIICLQLMFVLPALIIIKKQKEETK